MTLRYSKQKIAAALQLLTEFKATRFPHTDSTVAVEALSSILSLTNKQLDGPSSPALAKQTEMEATALIDGVLGLLGIISNSANVRNSFEIHGPVLDLAKQLLSDNDAKLIISFEWNYIPFTYPQNHPHLPSFVVIGLPASEASNALVLPVIGHELGHSLWLRDKCRDHFEPEINQAIIRAIKGPLQTDYERLFRGALGISASQCDDYQYLWTWEDAANNCFRQIEEIFSDFVGLRLFGISYLDSFEYLLSPALSTERDPQYPADVLRARYLEDNSERVGVKIEGNYKNRFTHQSSPFHPKRNAHFQMILADAASETLVNSVADHVADLCGKRSVLPPDTSETKKILENFLQSVPAERTTGLGPILNAGWSAFKDPQFMDEYSDLDRMKTINELILKSVEIYEIERMTGHGSKKKHPSKSS
jgi:hypothetical protein